MHYYGEQGTRAVPGIMVIKPTNDCSSDLALNLSSVLIHKHSRHKRTAGGLCVQCTVVRANLAITFGIRFALSDPKLFRYHTESHFVER